MTEKPKLLEACGLERIQALMGEVVRKTSESEGACVYRGEPECYPVVSSGLYRKCSDSTKEAFDIARVEQEMTENARQYTTLTNDDEILAEIQHFGGSTNLIDFTDDYLIALFFASLGSDGKDGRVVLHWSDQDTVVRPKQTINRVVFQKSVFVRPQRGFIVPDPQDEIVVVPGDLKAGILSFLQRFHGISERTVFNDIHGFIRHQTPDHSLYVGEFRQSLERPQRDTSQDLKFCLAMGQKITADLKTRGHAFHQKGMVYENQKKGWLSINPLTGPPGPGTSYSFYFEPDELIALFTHLIDNNLSAMRVEKCIFWRGEAYLYLRETELAMRDFEEALARNPKMAKAYHGRGNAFRQQSETGRAMADFEEALRLQPVLPAACIDRGNVYLEGGPLAEAIQDYDKAISIMRMGAYYGPPGIGDGHFFRAVARCVQHDWREAKTDLEAARTEGVLVASSFRNIVGGVAKFEADYGLRMPSAVATMLYVDER